MLLLSTIGLVVPAVFHQLARGSRRSGVELKLDTEIAVVLFVDLLRQPDLHAAHASRPVRSRRWPARMTAAHSKEEVAPRGDHALRRHRRRRRRQRAAGRRRSSETARDLGMTNLFVGVVVVALIGNAAEHFSAVVLAAEDKMDAAIGIAVGSSTQIALFVAPVLVFLSYLIAPQPMDLLFTTFELVAIALVGAEHRVHRARRRDQLDGGRAAARGLRDPVAGVLLPAGIGAAGQTGVRPRSDPGLTPFEISDIRSRAHGAAGTLFLRSGHRVRRRGGGGAKRS